MYSEEYEVLRKIFGLNVDRLAHAMYEIEDAHTRLNYDPEFYEDDPHSKETIDKVVELADEVNDKLEGMTSSERGLINTFIEAARLNATLETGIENNVPPHFLAFLLTSLMEEAQDDDSINVIRVDLDN